MVIYHDNNCARIAVMNDAIIIAIDDDDGRINPPLLLSSSPVVSSSLPVELLLLLDDNSASVTVNDKLDVTVGVVDNTTKSNAPERHIDGSFDDNDDDGSISIDDVNDCITNGSDDVNDGTYFIYI